MALTEQKPNLVEIKEPAKPTRILLAGYDALKIEEMKKLKGALGRIALIDP